MVVRAKIEKNEIDEDSLERERMKIIQQGAPIAKEPKKKDWYNFTLRIKYEMLDQIDEALKEIAGLNKTGFILQAIQEKLRRSKE